MAFDDRVNSIEDRIDVNDVLGSANIDWTPLGETFVKYVISQIY